MNISKLISKFVLAFLVFSSISVQGPILAGSGETESTIPSVTGKNEQQYEQYKELRKRSKWKNMFLWTAYLALSAGAFYGCHTFPDGHPNRLEVAAFGVCCGIIGAFGMYDFLKARIWGR